MQYNANAEFLTAEQRKDLIQFQPRIHLSIMNYEL
jgi:hypothetical protein